MLAAAFLLSFVSASDEYNNLIEKSSRRIQNDFASSHGPIYAMRHGVERNPLGKDTPCSAIF